MLALEETGYHWSSTIIWAKDKFVLSRKDYNTQYEPIWYGWNIDNVVMKTDEAANIKPDKEKATQKIDGAVASIMALDRAIKREGRSVYATRGIMILDKNGTYHYTSQR